MSLFDMLFGGTDNSAQDQQLRQNREAAEVIQRNAERARQDALSLFPAAQGAMAQGIQSAMDLYGQSAPQQMQVFQQGNMGAQDAMLTGLSGIQQALMGRPMDLRAESLRSQFMSPIGYDTSYFRQQVPQFQYADQMGLAPGNPQQPQQQQPDISQLLAMLGRAY